MYDPDEGNWYFPTEYNWKILFCPKCCTRQNFDFGKYDKLGICMVCSHEVDARFVDSLSALAFDEYQSELRLKKRLSKELDEILDKEV